MDAPTRRSYELVADRYAAEIGDELQHKPLDRALLDAFAELTAGGPIADVGCGPGHVSDYLLGRGARAVGLDLSPAMCAVARRTSSAPVGAADMTALPIRSATLTGIVCLYAVIHLDTGQRACAYAEFARVLRPGGHALIAFHTSDADVAAGGAATVTEWWGYDVELTFRFLDPVAETRELGACGLELVARLDRAPHPGAEHASQRTYLILRRP